MEVNTSSETTPMLDSSEMNDCSTQAIEKPKKLSFLVYALTFLSALGGFLFGYDTGVVSGTLVLLKDEFHMSSLDQEIFVSITMGSAVLFSLVAGFAIDAFGRKKTILTASISYLIGSAVLAFAYSTAALLAGRFIVGAGIGLSSGTIPVYIAECSPKHIRGRLVSINNVFITAGQFIASIICGAFSFDLKHGWRFMLGLAAVPAFVQFVFFVFMPESPRWLFLSGREERALINLRRMEGDEVKVEEELREMRASVVEEDGERGYLKIVLMLKTKHVRRALFVGVMLQLVQQFVGINTVMYYSATIIQMSGIEDPSDAIWLAALVASVNFLFSFVGLVFVDRIGRRKLILSSLLGTFLSLVVLGTGFLLADADVPSVNFPDPRPSVCSNYTNCRECITDTHCGYCYHFDSHAYNATCVYFAPKDPPVDSNVYGPRDDLKCGNDSNRPDWNLATKLCPTRYAWMSTFGLVLFLAFFAPGMGPMPWTINSEIYPGWARGTGNSVSTCANWLSNLVVSMTFLTLTETITTYGAFYLYAGFAFCGLVCIFLVLPETKNRSLEDIENLFKGPALIPCMADGCSQYKEIEGDPH